MVKELEQATVATPISLVGGRYRLERLVGKGGMGAVYKAFDEQLKRYVAIKCLLCTTDSLSKESALQEAWTLSSINHPNVMQIFDVVTIEDQIWLVTEWIEGRVLSEFDGALHPLLAVAIMSQVYQGLAASHENGIVHRDIKPANIMVTTKGRVVLLDYGVALAPGVSSGETIVGSLRYTDSRILEGRKADQYSDLFSAALVTLELLRGKPVLPELAPLPAYRYIREKLERKVDTFADGLYPPLAQMSGRYLFPHVKVEHQSSDAYEAYFVADALHDIFVEMTEHSPYKVIEKFNKGTFDWASAIQRTEDITESKLHDASLTPKWKSAWFSYSESLKREDQFLTHPDNDIEEIVDVSPMRSESHLSKLPRALKDPKKLLGSGAFIATAVIVVLLIANSKKQSQSITGPQEAAAPPATSSLPVAQEVAASAEKEPTEKEASEAVKQAVKEAVKEAMVEAGRGTDPVKKPKQSSNQQPKLTVRTFVLDEPGRLYINGVNQGFIIDRKPISISLGVHDIWVERNGKLTKLSPVTIGSNTTKVIRIDKRRAM